MCRTAEEDEFSKVKFAIIVSAFVSAFLAWPICIPREGAKIKVTFGYVCSAHNYIKRVF